MRKLGIVVTFVFNNFQRKEIWRDTLKQSMRKSSILVTNVNINLQQTEVSRLILNHEWYLFWLPSILLFYLIKSGLQSQLRRFWAQQSQVHKNQKSLIPHFCVSPSVWEIRHLTKSLIYDQDFKTFLKRQEGEIKVIISYIR